MHLDTTINDLSKPSFGFDVSVFDKRRCVSSIYCDLGSFDGFLGCATCYKSGAHHIAGAFIVQLGSLGRHCIIRCERGCKGVPINGKGRFFQCINRRDTANNCRDSFAFESAHAFGKNGLVRKCGNDAKAVFAGYVLGCHDRDDAWIGIHPVLRVPQCEF